MILAYILTSWIRLPYSLDLNRVQRFLYDVCEPYLRLFRRFLPPLGPLDLSPIVGVIVLFVLDRIVRRRSSRAALEGGTPWHYTRRDPSREARAAAVFGYGRDAVDKLLDEIAESFEDVWRERAELADKRRAARSDLRGTESSKTLLRTTLVSAERAAQELRDQARARGRRIVAEAHAEARAVSRRAAAERERLDGRAAAHPGAAAPRRSTTVDEATARSSRGRRGVDRARSADCDARIPGGVWPHDSPAIACLSRAPGRAAVVGRHGDGWKVRVTARARAGARANEAVLALLAGRSGR